MKAKLYDIVMSPEFLAAVRERRNHPDGQMHDVKYVLRGNVRVLSYPWHKMELGGFFLAPIGERSEKAMRVTFAHTAARLDIEVSVSKYTDELLGPVLRVTLVLFGLRALKIKAEQHHNVEGLKYSDGRWLSTRKARAKTKPKRVVPVNANKPKPADDVSFAARAKIEPEPDIFYTREEMIKRAMGEGM